VTARHARKWYDLVALIAVIGGLLLVAYEIRQANVFAKASTESSVLESWENLSMAEIESGINAVVAKAIENPTGITLADRLDIGSWLTAVISIYQRNGRMHYEYGLAADPSFSGVGSYYFTTEVSRDWFELNERWISRESPKLAEEIRKYIETTPIDSTVKNADLDNPNPTD